MIKRFFLLCDVIIEVKRKFVTLGWTSGVVKNDVTTARLLSIPSLENWIMKISGLVASS